MMLRIVFVQFVTRWHDQLTNDELSASCRDEFESASKIQRAPHSLMNANCEPEKGWMEKGRAWKKREGQRRERGQRDKN